MALVGLVSAGVAITLLYRTGFEEQRARLVETAESRARLIEAVARFDAIYSHDYPEGPTEATISQVVDAHQNFEGFGETGEFTLARHEGENIVFLLSQRHHEHERPDSESGGLLLCEGLLSIDFIYYDSDGEPHETWDSGEEESKGKLPSRVSISMEFEDSTNPDTPYKFMTGVAIPMGG